MRVIRCTASSESWSPRPGAATSDCWSRPRSTRRRTSFTRTASSRCAQLDGRSVLLIDDTWTTGANAQSAAAALKSAGAGRVAAVVIGRHLNREWHENDRRLRGITRPFDWSHCALCARPATPPDPGGRSAVNEPELARALG